MLNEFILRSVATETLNLRISSRECLRAFTLVTIVKNKILYYVIKLIIFFKIDIFEYNKIVKMTLS
jgi:hypothetical protein